MNGDRSFDQRSVRPRISVSNSLEAPLGGTPASDSARARQNASGASASQTTTTINQCARLSPLLEILERAVTTRTVVKDPTGRIFTGFASFSDLARSLCKFVPMNSNRAISRDVVRDRVEENLVSYEQNGCYMEFGQINLIIMAQDASYDFLVMDGQHRCEAMQELFRRFPDREVVFQFRAKAVDSETQAFEELQHFQRAYPTDSRSFFRSRAEARAGTAVLLQLKALHAAAFREMVLSDRHGRGTRDPVRPYLNDCLLFWLLQDARLLSGTEAGSGAANGAADAATALATLLRMNNLMATLPRSDLGKGATENMQQIAVRTGCWLGFFREGMLQWRDLENRLASAAILVDLPSESRARPSSSCSAAVDNSTNVVDCVVCLEQPQVVAMLPCGHLCACETCAAALRDARPPLCPLCRGDITNVQRIYR